MSEPSDEELAARYRAAGEQAVLGQLYRRYLEQVYGLCLQYLRDVGRAEDAAMDIYEQLVPKLRRHEVTRFRPWLYRLARNHCLMLLRRPASSLTLHSTSISERHTLAPEDVQLGDGAHLGHGAADGVADAEERERMLELLEECHKALPPRQADCVRRCYLEGEAYADIAASLGLTYDKVRSAIQNGRRNLRLCFERHRHDDA